MIPLSEAVERVLSVVAPLPAAMADLRECVGLVLAADIIAAVDVPPFANSAMDGFAVRSVDCRDVTNELLVVDTVLAGEPAQVAVREGTAVRIMTGAPLPDGADAVVMVERSRRPGTSDDGVERVVLDGPVGAGTAVRAAGDDVAAGSVVVPAGTRVTPGVIGAARSAGIVDADVIRRPVVGVISTGDELVEPPGSLGPGQIYESNRASLVAAVRLAGCEPVDLGNLPDDVDTVRDAFESGAASCGAIVSSGGVSMGDVDVVRTVLEELGEIGWMQIAIRPAKPFACGVLEVDGRRVPLFGLPGNPVSSLVSFELLARPALSVMAGGAPRGAAAEPAVLAAAITRRDDGKIHFVRGRFGERGPSGLRAVEPLVGQGSHHMSTMAIADALIVVPPGDGAVSGDIVEVISLPGGVS